MARRILVPLDGSPLAAAAIPYAVTLAQAREARLSLLAIVGPVPEHADLPSAAGQAGDERQVAASTAYLESVATPLRARGLAVTAVVRHGNPAREILAASEEGACSLIVMSTHGRTGLARVRAGSVARQVLRHASIPTLVVRPGDGESTAGAAAITAITVTLDGSALAEEALPIATRLAAALAVPLTLLRITPELSALSPVGWGSWDPAYYPVNETLARDEDRAVGDYLAAIAARLREPGLAVRTDWERGVANRPEERIAAYLAQRPTGIAVMASHGRGGVLRWALGSTVEEVVDRAPCPILIVRAGTTAAGAEDPDVPTAPRAG